MELGAETNAYIFYYLLSALTFPSATYMWQMADLFFFLFDFKCA